ncbi:hypothetical protein NUW54_g9097 [Trametes sanguinea]|uniref:Uncharacterized protein n=1 Tax=Trametes sanguinea TaxID=158606 RepID=A0ACC1PBC1_9APHY|nr:hypothetical protein NUW54_g9097 [Trametes sanguinea]
MMPYVLGIGSVTLEHHLRVKRPARFLVITAQDAQRSHSQSGCLTELMSTRYTPTLTIAAKSISPSESVAQPGAMSPIRQIDAGGWGSSVESDLERSDAAPYSPLSADTRLELLVIGPRSRRLLMVGLAPLFARHHIAVCLTSLRTTAVALNERCRTVSMLRGIAHTAPRRKAKLGPQKDCELIGFAVKAWRQDEQPMPVLYLMGCAADGNHAMEDGR